MVLKSIKKIFVLQRIHQMVSPILNSNQSLKAVEKENKFLIGPKLSFLTAQTEKNFDEFVKTQFRKIYLAGNHSWP